MNKKKKSEEKKTAIPGDAKTKSSVGVTGNPKLNKPIKKRKV